MIDLVIPGKDALQLRHLIVAAVRNADIAVSNINDVLDLLNNPWCIIASLRR